jgi:hypothetical protein
MGKPTVPPMAPLSQPPPALGIPDRKTGSECHVAEAGDGRCMDLDLPHCLPGDSAY